MTTITGTTRGELHDQVHQLAAQGYSNRAIAAEIGVSKDTVRRWLNNARAAARATTPPGAPASAPPATPDEPPAHGGAPRNAPPALAAHATPPNDAPPAPLAPAADAPPARQPDEPDLLAVPLDDELRAHLAVFAEAGVSGPAAVAVYLRFIADAVADAWNHGVCPRGLLPTMRIQSRHPAVGAPPDTSHHA